MTNKKREPLVIIVSAPSGSGKTTIVSKLLEKMTEVRRSISYTTREPREGEENGDDYIFITDSEFRKRIEENDFLEYEENFGKFYGTSREQFQKAQENGEDIILSIDVKGARRVKKNFPESVSIFIMPPSEEELKNRLEGRKTEEDRQVSMRLREAKNEIEASDEYEYMIINKDLETAVEELKEIIEKMRKIEKQ